jgi:DNA repair protein RadC
MEQLSIFDENKVCEVSVRYKKLREIKSTQIKSSSDVADIARLFFDNHLDGVETREHFIVLCLNRKNQVTNIYHASSGGVSGTVVDAKLIFCAAIQILACSIILCHNHPSGNKQPSQPDINLTQKLIAGGKVLDVMVLDHVILTDTGYYSFLDEGLIPD